jgi:hypothetical protein
MTMESTIVREFPLHLVLADDGVARLRYEIDKAAREFGYDQLARAAEKYGAATISVRFEIRQTWTPK